MNFQRYSQGAPITGLSASDMNARAESLEMLLAARGSVVPQGMIGVGGALMPVVVTPLVTMGKITDRSSATSVAGSSLTYKAESFDGSLRITTFKAPLFRPFSSSTIMVPAAINSPCILGWFPDVTANAWVAEILWAKETEDSAECA